MNKTGGDATGEGGAASQEVFSPGDLIADRFLVVRLLGAGGLGQVYEVADHALGGPAALKILKPAVSTNPVLLERFRREIQNARRITHPNVCRVFDLGIHRSSQQHRFFVTMEVLAGEDLATYLASRPALSPAAALPVLAQVAAGLQAAHDSGVIHRDLKPANIMLLPDGNPARRAVITDFGLAISVDQLDLGLTDTWELIGTPEYMAPEQTRRGSSTPATDVYALGLIAYEMLTRGSPFEREATSIATVIKRRYEPPRPLRQTLPDIAPAWEAAIGRCLEAEPARRFQRPADFVVALGAGGSGSGNGNGNGNGTEGSERLAAPTIHGSRAGGPKTGAGGELQVAVMGPNSFGMIPLPARGTLTIGRAEDADLRVIDANASRLHARLHVDGATRLFVEDLGTKSGTFLREAPIAPNQLVPVQPGEAIRIGFTIIMIQRRSLAPQARRYRSHATFEERLQEACETSEKTGATFAVARFKLSGGDRDGQAAGVLAGDLRTGDVLAQYAPADYELLLPDTTAQRARDIVAELQRRLEAAALPSQVAMAFYPGDARTPDGLIEKANSGVLGIDGEEDGAPVVRSESMRKLHKMAGRAAVGHGSDGLIGVLILGECGVGKDVLAHWIHAKSPRAQRPFVAVNCGTFTETLLNSELFGHERGAFTDAKNAKAGILEAAGGGTVFLDEIGDMPLHLQVRLLHAIQNRAITRVGDGARARPIDVRFIAATNRDLPNMVAGGSFREDLYYRLNQITLTVPPLRERAEEIESLARHFLSRAAGAAGGKRRPPRLSAEALDVLRAYCWPGNVRELRNMIDRAVVLCEGSEIKAEHLDMEKIRTTRMTASPPAPAPASGAAPGGSAGGDAGPVDLGPGQRAERARIIDALAECSYNQKLAAKRLDISRGTLISRMRRYGIPRPRATGVRQVR